MRRLANTALLLTTAFALVAAPLPAELGATWLGADSAFAKGGNGKGNGNGNGNGASSESHGNAGNGGSQGNSGGSDDTPAVKKTASTNALSAPGKLNAKLGSLNSLKRNINGLMNSADPKMTEIRSFVLASAQLAADQAALTQAQIDLAAAQALLDELVQSLLPVPFDGNPDAYGDGSLQALEDRLTTLDDALASDPNNADILAEIAALNAAIETIEASTELAAVATLSDQVNTLSDAVAAGIAATDDDSLVAALVAASNKPGSVDGDVLEWAKQQLGVGDFDGLIDDYMTP